MNDEFINDGFWEDLFDETIEIVSRAIADEEILPPTQAEWDFAINDDGGDGA